MVHDCVCFDTSAPSQHSPGPHACPRVDRHDHSTGCSKKGRMLMCLVWQWLFLAAALVVAASSASRADLSSSESLPSVTAPSAQHLEPGAVGLPEAMPIRRRSDALPQLFPSRVAFFMATAVSDALEYLTGKNLNQHLQPLGIDLSSYQPLVFKQDAEFVPVASRDGKADAAAEEPSQCPIALNTPVPATALHFDVRSIGGGTTYGPTAFGVDSAVRKDSTFIQNVFSRSLCGNLFMTRGYTIQSLIGNLIAPWSRLGTDDALSQDAAAKGWDYPWVIIEYNEYAGTGLYFQLRPNGWRLGKITRTARGHLVAGDTIKEVDEGNYADEDEAYWGEDAWARRSSGGRQTMFFDSAQAFHFTRQYDLLYIYLLQQTLLGTQKIELGKFDAADGIIDLREADIVGLEDQFSVGYYSGYNSGILGVFMWVGTNWFLILLAVAVFLGPFTLMASWVGGYRWIKSFLLENLRKNLVETAAMEPVARSFKGVTWLVYPDETYVMVIRGQGPHTYVLPNGRQVTARPFDTVLTELLRQKRQQSSS